MCKNKIKIKRATNRNSEESTNNNCDKRATATATSDKAQNIF